MPQGKPAGVRCVQLDEDNLCRLFGEAERPVVCRSFSASIDGCGENREEAVLILRELEEMTR
jgi:Fe-S-cluster containining protein